MSLARIGSFAFSGIEAVPVEVQVQISSGLPAFLIVGIITFLAGQTLSHPHRPSQTPIQAPS